MKDKRKKDDLYLKKAELGELFDSSYPLEINLWRGQKPKERGSPILYPILKSFKLSNGKTRPADVKTYMKNNEIWISSKGGGVSLFDALGAPVKSWDYYRIPAGTPIPMGLYITKDEFNPNYRATHYTIYN